MQRMKSYAAPSGIIHWLSKEMIEIDKHRRAHGCPRTQETLAIKDTRDRSGDQEMQCKVYV